MTNSSDYKKEIIEKLFTGELEIIQYETNSDVEMIPNRGNFHICTSGKTVTITCQFRQTDKDLIKELEEENRELRLKLDKLNQILNPSQDEDYD